MAYYLTTGGMRVVQVNERGVVTWRKEYSRGDEVDVDRLEEGRLDLLLETGDLVEKKDDVPTDDGGESPATVTAAASAVTAGSTSTAPHNAAGQPLSPVTGEDVGSREVEKDIDEDPNAGGDRYDSMSWPDLQAEAKTRTGDASGGKEAVIGRLRAQDKMDVEA